MGVHASYIYLEDLGDPRTKGFIERHSKKLNEFLGELSEELLPEVLKWYGVEYVYTYQPCSGRVYLVLRSGEGFRVIEEPGGRVVFEKPGVVVWGVYPSYDCSMIGVGYTSGSDESVIDVMDLNKLNVIDKVEGYVYGIAWRGDGRYYYLRMYRREPPPDGGDVPAERVILRDPYEGREEVIWGRGLPKGYLVSIYPVYEEDIVVLLVSKGWSESILYAGPLDEPRRWELLLSPNSPVTPAGVYNGSIYAIVYDEPGTGRIVEASKDGVREVVSAHGRYPLEQAIAYEDGIVAVRLVDAKSIIEVYDFKGGLRERIEPEEPSTILFVKRWEERVLAEVESFNRPMGLYELPYIEPLYEPKVDLGLDVSEDWTISGDGTRIHYFIVKEPGTRIKNAILYGYGGFGLSLTPWYIGYLKPLLDKGFAYVMANLRGGREYGEKWHEAGRRLNKRNVFEDFKSVAKKLKSQGFRIAGWGASNGGLLIAAVLVQEPGLLDAAVIGYPVIDMLRFHKLYIGSIWIDEYGDPEDPKYREYLLSYSPIHNAKPAKYLPTLIYTGLHDDRVHPGHALRFAAVLEDLGAPVYLRVETIAGHMGADPKIKARELADIQAFILRALHT
ncbi:MAG: prolyl oligopeptidase family serine peptidase [Desulfurococcales archaeon]|nr:prolyl oligopeptidase family serine peptidase [Desulfurococcales archaeon]